jgi:acetolactate decarboxylase
MMRTRSVPRQVKPHPLLTEVTAHQPEFTMENISGTIVGFRF